RKNAGLLGRTPLRSIRGAAFFRDDFTTFNKGNWNYEVSMYGGYNGEFQVYTNDPKNVFTRDGSLYIYPENLNGCTRDGHNGILPPVMSGKVKSVPVLKYGTLEVRARIPKGDWLWPGRVAVSDVSGCLVVWCDLL
ncbi:unnamed protein product, partial [Candidula unifasciata]